MKKLTLNIIFLAAVVSVSAQGLRIGVHVDPQFSWLKPEARNVVGGDYHVGVNGGLILENYFAENYAFTTGLEIGTQGGRLKFGEATTIKVYNEEDSLPAGTVVDYKLNYLTVPLGLKLKSNQIGYFTYYVMLGFTPQFRMDAKASSSDGSLSKDNIKKEINWFNLSYHFGGGIEYAISEDTSLLLGIVYHNGFLDVTDNNNATVYSRNLAIRIGVMF